LRFCGIVKNKRVLDQFEPIYGLPTRSLDEWLSRNPARKKVYEAELLNRSRRSCSARDKRLNGACRSVADKSSLDCPQIRGIASPRTSLAQGARTCLVY